MVFVFKKWANRSFPLYCSGPSPKMSKWANRWGFLVNRPFFEWIACSFFSQKQAIHSENRWANSQPWKCNTNETEIGFPDTVLFIEIALYIFKFWIISNEQNINETELGFPDTVILSGFVAFDFTNKVFRLAILAWKIKVKIIYVMIYMYAPF